MIYSQIYYHLIKFIPKLIKLKKQEWSMSCAVRQDNKQITTKLQNETLTSSLVWLEWEWFIESNSHVPSVLLWKYLNDDGSLRLTNKWKIFIENYERMFFWLIPVGRVEFWYQDFPFLIGAVTLAFFTAFFNGVVSYWLK